MAKPTKEQLLKFGEYVYRCDPDMFERWIDDERENAAWTRRGE